MNTYQIKHIKEKIKNVKAKIVRLHNDIVKIEAAGMDSRQHQKWLEDYINQEIEMTAKLRKLEGDES